MAYSNGIITAPVSFYDVQLALGDSSQDLGTLCKSTKINMWSRNKPMDYPALFSNNNGIGINNKYGLFAQKTDNCVYLNQVYNYGLNGWSYENPYGTVLSPYRMGDFDGYYSGAIPFVDSFTSTTQRILVEGNRYIGYSIHILRESEVNLSYRLSQLFLSSFELGDYYFGVCLIGATATYRATSSTTISNTTNTVDFYLPSSIPLGVYTAYPFVSKYSLTQNGADITGNEFYSLPSINPLTLSIVESIINASFEGSINNNICTYSVTLNNRNTISETFNSVRVLFRYQSNAIGDAQQTGEVFIVRSPKTVAAGADYTYSDSTVDVTQLLLNNNLYVKVYLSITTQSGETITKEYRVNNNGGSEEIF